MASLAQALDGLRRPAAYPHPVDRVEVIDTHISRVFLAGDYAYKLKRPVSLGFVDFSTLARRHFYCEEELRLNRRLAPQLYLDVVQVTLDHAGAVIGGKGEVVDYAVRMNRFSNDALLSRRLPDAALIDRLAERIARFHASLVPVPKDSPFGEPEAILAPMLDNFAPIRGALACCSGAEPDSAKAMSTAVEHLESWTRAQFDLLRPALETRRREGHIRECHGDMHRGNIAVIDGEPVIFDCIEFNPGLRWIDTMSELAFLTMDLTESGAHALARRALNRYLEVTGDYAGLRVFGFYQVYRALVRAKVSAIQLSASDQRGQGRTDPASSARMSPVPLSEPSSPVPSPVEPDRQAPVTQQASELARYIELARAFSARQRPRLFITHGLSGSGKTWLGAELGSQLPIVQLRSDIERKRLFGIPEPTRPRAHQTDQLYSAEATRRTYGRLLSLARLVLEGGFSALVDATFLKIAQRAPFLSLGRELGFRCTILALHAPMHLLRERIRARQLEGRDASDADIDVLGMQIAAREALTDDERHTAVFLDTATPLQMTALLRRVAELDAFDGPVGPHPSAQPRGSS